MTVPELLAKKKAIYLFTQHGWAWYACGNRYYKVSGDIILPADK